MKKITTLLLLLCACYFAVGQITDTALNSRYGVYVPNITFKMRPFPKKHISSKKTSKALKINRGSSSEDEYDFKIDTVYATIPIKWCSYVDNGSLKYIGSDTLILKTSRVIKWYINKNGFKYITNYDAETIDWYNGTYYYKYKKIDVVNISQGMRMVDGGRQQFYKSKINEK